MLSRKAPKVLMTVKFKFWAIFILFVALNIAAICVRHPKESSIPSIPTTFKSVGVISANRLLSPLNSNGPILFLVKMENGELAIYITEDPKEILLCQIGFNVLINHDNKGHIFSIEKWSVEKIKFSEVY